MNTICYKGNSTKVGIYAIRNNTNNKIYIGSTKKSFHSRKTKHLNSLRKGVHNNTHLQSSYNKYGESSFTFEILLICDSDDSIVFFENYYIFIFRSHLKDFGYNKSVAKEYLGSYKQCKEAVDRKSKYKKEKAFLIDSSLSSERGLNKPVLVFNIEGKLENEFKSCTDLCSHYKWSKTAVSTSLTSGKHYFKNKIISFKSDSINIEDEVLKAKKYLPKKVFMYDLEDNFLKEFNSVKDVCKELQCKEAEVRMCCTGKRSRIKNFKFYYNKNNE